jgi:hypothetical protein
MEVLFEELPDPLIHLGTFAGCLTRLQRLSPLGLGGVTLDGRDPDPEGAGRLGLGHTSPEGVHDLLTEVFGVRFHRSMLPCSPSSSQHAVERDFEVHILAFSRQGGPKSHVRSLMVFGNVMIYLTELADKLGIDPVEAAKSKVAINGIQDGAYPSIGATRCLETGVH